MQNFDLENGCKEFTINNDPEKVIRFAPADTDFLERLYNAVNELEKNQGEYRSLSQGIEDANEAFALLGRANIATRKIIDDAFDEPVCDVVFGSQSLYSLVGGAPIWVSFMTAILDECAKELTAQEKKVNPRLQALMKKYGKRGRK